MHHLHSIFISYGSWEMLVGLGPQLPVQTLPHSLVSVGFTPALAEAVVPPGNPCRKGQHSLSNLNHGLIQMCLKYRLMPSGQDSDTCGAGERAGLVGFTGIHLSLSHLVFCFSLCWTRMGSLTSPLAPLRAGVKAAVVAAGKGWRMLEASGCFLQRDLAGTLGVTWQLLFLSHILLALISVLRVKTESQVLCTHR